MAAGSNCAKKSITFSLTFQCFTIRLTLAMRNKKQPCQFAATLISKNRSRQKNWKKRLLNCWNQSGELGSAASGSSNLLQPIKRRHKVKFRVCHRVDRFSVAVSRQVQALFKDFACLISVLLPVWRIDAFHPDIFDMA
jgi:transposase